MSLPRIGISGVRSPVEGPGRDRTGVRSDYLAAVLAAGGLPLVLGPELGPLRADAALAICDGLVLSGGADIEPRRYGGIPSDRLGATDPDRDAFELALFGSARERGLPILAICRGLQLANVALGGSLIQDLPSERPDALPHDHPDPWPTRHHEVVFTPGSRIHGILGHDRLQVSSFHHQAIDRLAAGLVASGRSADGIIEAVEAPADAEWLVGVQWHAESHHAEPGAADQRLFSALVEAASGAARVG